jgi:isocitrate dehydrogenase
MANVKVTAAMGDGIGKEIMRSTLDIIEAVGAPIDFEHVTVGEDVYLQGIKSGIPEDAWKSMSTNKVLLKGPITTPQGGGYKSLNVTIRKTMGLFANVRPVKAFSPYVKSNFPKMDVVVIRENEEDLYAGIEHQQSPEVVQCLKLVSRPGCEKIIRYAFEYAKAYGRKRVTCMTKDNIMKHTDGLFHEVFNEIAPEYPDIESDHYIIDIGTARVANAPDTFDVIVTLNLYGDIISDVTAEISGSVGLGGSANIGQEFAMFEAIHGSAPDIAGKDMANPSGLIHGACMMLVHLNMPEHAQKIQNALYKTIEDGIHTGDLKGEHTSKHVGTKEFTQAVIERLGQKPEHLTIPEYNDYEIKINVKDRPRPSKKLLGVDVFIDWHSEDRNPDDLGKMLEDNDTSALRLKMITNRGVKVYPDGRPETFCTDHWRCRFVTKHDFDGELTNAHIVELLSNQGKANLDAIKTENLYEIDGKRAYSLGQGE